VKTAGRHDRTKPHSSRTPAIVEVHPASASFLLIVSSCCFSYTVTTTAAAAAAAVAAAPTTTTTAAAEQYNCFINALSCKQKCKDHRWQAQTVGIMVF